jgi:hypothetical protein
MTLGNVNAMKYSIQLDPTRLPAGIAYESAAAGQTSRRVLHSAVLLPDAGEIYWRFLDGFPKQLLDSAPSPLRIRAGEVDSFLAILPRDGNATIYVNEPPIKLVAAANRVVKVGQPVSQNDLLDIREVRFGDVEIPADAAFIAIVSVGWGKVACFDFTSLPPWSKLREESAWAVLAHGYVRLLFEALYRMSESQWASLIAAHWFPFAGLRYDTASMFVEYIRNGWDPDELGTRVLAETKEDLQMFRDRWSSNKLVEDDFPLLLRGLSALEADDFITAVSVLTPRTEGILRRISASQGRFVGKQSALAAIPHELAAENSSPLSRLVPGRFSRFLEEAYFAGFDRENNPKSSRNAVGHGVLRAQDFDAKAALVAVLTLDHLLSHSMLI